jgi:hypothetical protein
MEPTRRTHLVLLAALIAVGVVGVATANADSQKKMSWTRQDICVNDPNGVAFDAVTLYGPPLRWITFNNECSEWELMAFNNRYNDGTFTVAFYIPPNTTTTVSTDTLNAAGLLNLQFDGFEYGGDARGDGTLDGPTCNGGLAGLPSFVVNADGSLTSITC